MNILVILATEALTYFGMMNSFFQSLTMMYLASMVAFVGEVVWFGKNAKKGLKERLAHSILYASGILAGVSAWMMFNEVSLLNAMVIGIVALLAEDVDEIARRFDIKLMPDALKEKLRVPKDKMEQAITKTNKLEKDDAE